MSPTIKTLKRHRRKKGHYELHLDDDTMLVLHEETVVLAHLHEGLTVEPQAWTRLLARDESRRCRARAWEILSLRPLPEKELERRLRKSQFGGETINETLERLRTEGFLDDESWARQFARERQARGEGPRLVESRLLQKGIERQLARDVMAEERTGAEDETRRAETQLRKWDRRSKPEGPQERARAAAQWLCRRGFDPDIVWPLIRRYFTVRDD